MAWEKGRSGWFLGESLEGEVPTGHGRSSTGEEGARVEGIKGESTLPGPGKLPFTGLRLALNCGETCLTEEMPQVSCERLMRRAAFSRRGRAILVNLRRDCGRGFWEKFTYSRSSPWVAYVTNALTIRIPLTILVAAERLALRPSPHHEGADLRESERLTIKGQNSGNPASRMLAPFPACDSLLNFRTWQSVKPNNFRVQKPTEPRTISTALLPTRCL